MTPVSTIPSHFELCPDCRRRARPGGRATITDIKHAVALETGVSAERMDSGDRRGDAVRARWIAMMLCRRLLGFGKRRIARAFRKDESSVRHADRALGAAMAAIDLPVDAPLGVWARRLSKLAPQVAYLGNRIGRGACIRKEVA